MVLSAWWRVVRAIGALERAVGIVLIASIVITITIQVLTRYFLGQPLVWVEEMAQYSFIWMVFIGASLGFKELRHITIDTFVAKLSPALRSLWKSGLYLLMTATALVVAWYAWDIMSIEGKSNTMSLPIELPRMWFYSVPLATAMVSIALTGTYFVFAYGMQALADRPVDAELDLAARRLAEAAEEAVEVERYDERVRELTERRRVDAAKGAQ